MAALSPSAFAAFPNLITNGDFEAANPQTGWTSPSYTYVDPASPTALFPAGVLRVDTNPGLLNVPFWSSFGDTAVPGFPWTTTHSKFLIVNGSSASTVPQPDVVWQHTAPIPVTALTDLDGAGPLPPAPSTYFFEAWVAQNAPLGDPNRKALLSFELSENGGTTWVNLGQPETDAGAGVWKGLSTTYSPTADGNVLLRLVNRQTAFNDNDFSVDDIYFGNTTTIPEVSTIAPVLALLGLTGFVINRRRSSKA